MSRPDAASTSVKLVILPTTCVGAGVGAGVGCVGSPVGDDDGLGVG